jgi:hypothetical protein
MHSLRKNIAILVFSVVGLLVASQSYAQLTFGTPANASVGGGFVDAQALFHLSRMLMLTTIITGLLLMALLSIELVRFRKSLKRSEARVSVK